MTKKNKAFENTLNAAGSMYILISMPDTSYEIGIFAKERFLQNLGIYNERCLKFRSDEKKNRELLMALKELGTFDKFLDTSWRYSEVYDEDGTPNEYKAVLIIDIYFINRPRKGYVRLFVNEKEKAFNFINGIERLFAKRHQINCLFPIKEKIKGFKRS
ncbi:MAG: hypothetical protein Aureis2KO_08650 [Aureisphaera sp.]